MTENYDVVIVGGGPGGSIAAKTAAELGLKTVFIERSEPGEKNSSGCGLGPRMWRDFDFMKECSGDLPSFRMARCVINHYLNEEGKEIAFEAYYPTSSVTYEPAKTFITSNVYRSEFDPWLVKFAVGAGAKLIKNALVNKVKRDDRGHLIGIKTDKGHDINGKIIIGADGVLSLIARMSGLRSKYAQDQVTLVPQYDFKIDPAKADKIIGPDGFHSDAACAIWYGMNFPAAYQVIFRDGFHIGLGSWMGQWQHNPLHYLNKCVNSPAFKLMMKAFDAKPREIQSHLLPWTSSPGKTYTNNVILVGDAGGFPCPLEAEGVYPAMITGKFAAEVAADAISAGDTSESFLKKYEEKWQNSSIGEEFTAGESLQTLWRNLMFDLKNMKWFIPLWCEIRGGHYDWSEAHVVRFRQILNYVREKLPTILPWAQKYAMPVLADILEEDISSFGMLQGMLEKMLPKKKKKE